jgi:hypothetical protein
MSTITMPRTAVQMCDACGKRPPSHTEDGFAGTPICGSCARWRAGMYYWEACAAIEMIEYAIGRAEGVPAGSRMRHLPGALSAGDAPPGR